MKADQLSLLVLPGFLKEVHVSIELEAWRTSLDNASYKDKRRTECQRRTRRQSSTHLGQGVTPILPQVCITYALSAPILQPLLQSKEPPIEQTERDKLAEPMIFLNDFDLFSGSARLRRHDLRTALPDHHQDEDDLPADLQSVRSNDRQ
jgi:hypothetical protein